MPYGDGRGLDGWGGKMDLMESLRALRRQWILTSVLLMVTFAGTAGALAKLPWAYQSQATTVLLNSKSASASVGGNPYLAFADSLTLAADVVSLEVMDPRTADALQASGYPDSYQVVVSTLYGGPILQITVTGSKKSTVEHTLYGVLDEVSAKLLALQGGITPRNQIRSLVVSVTPQASRSVSKKAKPLVVVLGLGLVLTFAIPQIVDGMVSRRRLRRASGARRDGTGSPGGPVTSGRRDHRHRDGAVPASPGRVHAARRTPGSAEDAAGYKLDPERSG